MPSESRQIAQRSPGWTIEPPRSSTLRRALVDVGDREVGERGGVAGAAAALVDADADAVGLGDPAGALALAALAPGRPPAGRARSAGRARCRRRGTRSAPPSARRSAVARRAGLSSPRKEVSRPISCSNSPRSRKIPWHLRHCSIVTPLRSMGAHLAIAFGAGHRHRGPSSSSSARPGSRRRRAGGCVRKGKSSSQSARWSRSRSATSTAGSSRGACTRTRP